MDYNTYYSLFISAGFSKAEAAKAAASAVANGGNAPTSDMVYMGFSPVKTQQVVGRGDKQKTVTTTTQQPKTMTVDQAVASFYAPTKEASALKNRLRTTLTNMGYTNLTDVQLGSTWESLVKRSASQAAAGYKQTPWDILPMVVEPVAATGGPSTYTQTNVTKHTYNTQEIRADANSAVQKMLGRDITAAELKSITDKLNAYTAKKPATTTTVQRSSGAGTANSSSSVQTTSSGGTDTSQFILGQAEKLPGRQMKQSEDFYSWVVNLMAGGA